MRAVVFALLIAPTLVMAQGVDGLYRPDADWAEDWDCRSVGQDGGAVEIRDGVFHGVEAQCKLTNPVSVRDMDATLYDAICTGEGESWQARLMIMDTAEGIVTLRDGGDVSRYISCN